MLTGENPINRGTKGNENNKKNEIITMVNKNEKGVVDANERLNKSEAFFIKYKKAIVIAVVALILIIAGISLYRAFVLVPQSNKASTELAKAQEYFNMEQFDKALNGDGAGSNGFIKIINDYRSTDAGNLANLYAGLCYANLNKWNEAVKYLDAYSPADDAMVSPAAQAALGNAYAHVNQLDKAVSCLKKAAEMADSELKEGQNNSLSPTFLLQAGQILENQGKYADALKLYQDIKKNYVTSVTVQSGDIDKYIERASLK